MIELINDQAKEFNCELIFQALNRTITIFVGNRAIRNNCKRGHSRLLNSIRISLVNGRWRLEQTIPLVLRENNLPSHGLFSYNFLHSPQSLE